MITKIIQIFLLFLPAGFANVVPVLVKKINFLNYPVDLGAKFRDKPLFGKNKTYRGFFFGILAAILIVYIQKLLYLYINPSYLLVDYSQVNVLLLGFLFGFGALFGDLIGSFFKRRMDIKPGESWIPFDQIDWIIGAIIFLNIYTALSLNLNLLAVVLFGLLHPIVHYIGYLLEIEKKKF